MMVSTKKEDVKYTFIRLKLPEGLEVVEEGEDFTFNCIRIEPNALVSHGQLLVRTKEKKKKKKKTK